MVNSKDTASRFGARQWTLKHPCLSSPQSKPGTQKRSKAGFTWAPWLGMTDCHRSACSYLCLSWSTKGGLSCLIHRALGSWFLGLYLALCCWVQHHRGERRSLVKVPRLCRFPVDFDRACGMHFAWDPDVNLPASCLIRAPSAASPFQPAFAVPRDQTVAMLRLVAIWKAGKLAKSSGLPRDTGMPEVCGDTNSSKKHGCSEGRSNVLKQDSLYIGMDLKRVIRVPSYKTPLVCLQFANGPLSNACQVALS